MENGSGNQPGHNPGGYNPAGPAETSPFGISTQLFWKNTQPPYSAGGVHEVVTEIP